MKAIRSAKGIKLGPSDGDGARLRFADTRQITGDGAGAPLNSLPIFGLQAPLLVPAFSRRPMAH